MADNYKFVLTKGAVGSVLRFTLKDENGPVNLSGKTVTMSAKGSSLVITNAACVPDPDQDNNTGEGTYTFDSTTANIAVNKNGYDLQFKVVQGSEISYFPTNDNIYKDYGKLIVVAPL